MLQNRNTRVREFRDAILTCHAVEATKLALASGVCAFPVGISLALSDIRLTSD